MKSIPNDSYLIKTSKGKCRIETSEEIAIDELCNNATVCYFNDETLILCKADYDSYNDHETLELVTFKRSNPDTRFRIKYYPIKDLRLVEETTRNNYLSIELNTFLSNNKPISILQFAKLLGFSKANPKTTPSFVDAFLADFTDCKSKQPQKSKKRPPANPQ